PKAAPAPLAQPLMIDKVPDWWHKTCAPSRSSLAILGWETGARRATNKQTNEVRMQHHQKQRWDRSRRGFLRTSASAAALAGLGGLGLPRLGLAADGPWSTQPESEVDRLNFVVWTYGDIYSKIAAQFEQDWGVPVDSTISSFNDHPTKLVTMFAGGETIDVSQSSPFSFPSFIEQGLVEPLDGLPGIEDYVNDFTPFTKQVAQYDGQTMGLP
ncbi:MAG: twin-arginine translocation signal domain-containing protein, partial [Geminicoccaceae bacterium]